MRYLIAIICCCYQQVYAQQAVLADTPVLQWSGYAEVYWQYNANKPVENTQAPFVYSHHRLNEVAVNLAFVAAKYASKRYRANLALATGTYMNANYASEPGVLQHVFEANIGVRIDKRGQWWIDAGVMPSHIGFELATSKNCWALTRSMSADNSPYYEAGAKLSYTSNNQKWQMAFLLLNGWQRIQRVAGNSTPAFGTQLTYTPNTNITLNSSTYVGNDFPDSMARWRYFHNFYSIVQLHKKWAVTVGVDVGAQQANEQKSQLHTWWNTVVLLQYKANHQLSYCLRGEHFSDPQKIQLATGLPYGATIDGLSANVDYAITPSVHWRTEVKWMQSSTAVFQKLTQALTKQQVTMATSIAVDL